MRILHVVHQYYPDHVGGTEAHTRALARAQVAAGHEVTVFARRFAAERGVDRARSDGVDVVLASSGPYSAARRLAAVWREPFLARALAETAAEASPDVLHVQHLMGLPARALANVRARAIVGTLHDYWWSCANAQLYRNFEPAVCDGPRRHLGCARCGLARLGRGSLWPAAAILAPVFAARARARRSAARLVAAWIAPSDFVRDWHLRNWRPRGNVVTIRHGIDPPPAAAAAAAAARPTGRPARRFACLGGLSWQKGVHVLVEAFGEMPPDAELLVAGDESVFPDYCADLRRAARHPGIHFVGLLDEPGVWSALAGADALVVPSIWYETSSLIAQEALAVATPVIVSGHGALAERVRHERDGLHVRPGDARDLASAMRRLAGDAALLDRLRCGAAPIRTAAEASCDVEALYRSVLARSPG